VSLLDEKIAGAADKFAEWKEREQQAREVLNTCEKQRKAYEFQVKVLKARKEGA
jgi:hypothetical protein